MTTIRHRTMRSNAGFTIIETLFVVGIIGVVSAIAVPMVGNTIGNFKLTGDVRSMSNAIALTKMRAASDFSRTRLFVEVSGGRIQMQTWSKASATCCWVNEGGSTYMNTYTAVSYGSVATPPPNTQGAIAQAPPCKTDDGTSDIANTACVMFNSRGVPIDGATFAPTADDALYVTDGTAVYGVTVAATGMIRVWRTQPATSPTWVLQ